MSAVLLVLSAAMVVAGTVFLVLALRVSLNTSRDLHEGPEFARRRAAASSRDEIRESDLQNEPALAEILARHDLTNKELADLSHQVAEMKKLIATISAVRAEQFTYMPRLTFVVRDALADLLSHGQNPGLDALMHLRGSTTETPRNPTGATENPTLGTLQSARPGTLQ